MTDGDGDAPPGWRPLLDGGDAERARAAVAAIASDLAGAEPPDAALDGGHAGMALLWAYLGQSTGDDHAFDRAADSLEAALTALDQLRDPWLMGGFTGVAFAATQLSDLVEIDDDTRTGFDELVAHALDHTTPWPGVWDLITGLVGLGAYALERAGEAVAPLRARVVTHLAELAERGDSGLTWRAPPTLLLADEWEKNPRGYYNLGLAHGNPGAIAFLAGAIDQPGARELIAPAVEWVRAHDRGDPIARFPLMVGDGIRRRRVEGWCYGDQSVAWALFRAGQAAGRPEWIAHALDVARAAARRQPEADMGVSLCHGTVSRAHMFNRMAQATGDDELAEAARRSYRAALDARHPGRGPGGYAPEGKAPATGILTGPAGVALALEAAISEVEPVWDRALLVGPPPAP